MLYPALMTSLVCAWGYIDEWTFQWQTARAIVIGPLVGLLLGDVKTGLIIGATVELMFLSNVMVGSAAIPDVTTSSAVATALVITSGVDIQVGIALAVPVALFGQFMTTIRYTIVETIIAHLFDNAAAKGDIKTIRKAPFGMIIMALFYFIPVFIAVYFGSGLIETWVANMPQTLINAFNSGANLLGAVGFAMLLSMLRARKFVPFIFIGYVLASFLNVNILGIVILAMAVGAIYMLVNANSERRGVS